MQDAPTHHLHISTGFAFVAALFIIALVVIIAWAIVAWGRKKDAAPAAPLRPVQPNYDRPFVPRQEPSPYRSAPRSYTEPRRNYPVETVTPPAPAPMQGGSTSGFTAGEGFLGGLAMGGVLGAVAGSHHDSAPTYDPPASVQSSDGGFRYDSGSSASDSSSSGDSGSSGGFDVSW